MSLRRVSNFSPDILRSLNGLVNFYKPPNISSREVVDELRHKISSQLNDGELRPIEKRLKLVGELGGPQELIEVPNLADHPLVVGPRYLPWELKLTTIPPILSHRSSGVFPCLIGSAVRRYKRKLINAPVVSIYHVTGKFGYITDNMFYDGKIIDKSTYKHVRPGKMDAVLSRIESVQYERLFDAANVELHSQEAYELAKSWPSRPPSMSRWPVIYRIRCIHFKSPEFRLEVTCSYESEEFLAHLVQDVSVSLKSGAYTESIRRVKYGPMTVEQSLIDRDWDIEKIVSNIIQNSDVRMISQLTKFSGRSASVKSEYKPRLSENNHFGLMEVENDKM